MWERWGGQGRGGQWGKMGTTVIEQQYKFNYIIYIYIYTHTHNVHTVPIVHIYI